MTANRAAAMADQRPTGAAVAPITADRAGRGPGPATRGRPASPETRRLYAADWAAFEDWCRQAGRVWLPADATVLHGGESCKCAGARTPTLLLFKRYGHSSGVRAPAFGSGPRQR
jgi:hypothetical protein